MSKIMPDMPKFFVVCQNCMAKKQPSSVIVMVDDNGDLHFSCVVCGEREKQESRKYNTKDKPSN